MNWIRYYGLRLDIIYETKGLFWEQQFNAVLSCTVLYCTVQGKSYEYQYVYDADSVFSFTTLKTYKSYCYNFVLYSIYLYSINF